MRRKLLWIDGLAAAVAGGVVLLSSGWLSTWYRLPRDFLIFLALVNLVYASYSLSLAVRAKRPTSLIVLLVLANSAWAVACFWWAVDFRDTASLFGLAHLVGEGLFVGTLAGLEWRWRELLRTR